MVPQNIDGDKGAVVDVRTSVAEAQPPSREEATADLGEFVPRPTSRPPFRFQWDPRRREILNAWLAGQPVPAELSSLAGLWRASFRSPRLFEAFLESERDLRRQKERRRHYEERGERLRQWIAEHGAFGTFRRDVDFKVTNSVELTEAGVRKLAVADVFYRVVGDSDDPAVWASALERAEREVPAPRAEQPKAKGKDRFEAEDA